MERLFSPFQLGDQAADPLDCRNVRNRANDFSVVGYFPVDLRTSMTHGLTATQKGGRATLSVAGGGLELYGDG